MRSAARRALVVLVLVPPLVGCTAGPGARPVEYRSPLEEAIACAAILELTASELAPRTTANAVHSDVERYAARLAATGRLGGTERALSEVLAMLSEALAHRRSAARTLSVQTVHEGVEAWKRTAAAGGLQPGDLLEFMHREIRHCRSAAAASDPPDDTHEEEVP